ncbi:MAG TPA: trigger factor [Trueperaceae bacterium]|nr:trigger factor [Trueperaceae bacterium]
MEVKVLEKENVNAKIKVDIPAKDVSAAYKTVLQSVARQVKIAGFRPGRAPKGVLIKHVGEEILNEEVKDYLIEKTLAKALDKEGFVAVNFDITAEAATDNKDFSYEVKLELYPDISLPELSEIIIDTPKEEVSPEELTATLEELLEQNAILVPVERKIKASDQINIEILRDEESENSSIPIDLSKVDKDFAKQFVGKKIDDEFEIKVDAPEGEEDIILKVKVTDVKEKELAKLDDDFAKDLGLESFEELEENLRSNLQYRKDSDSFAAQREEFIEKLMADSDFELPESLVKRQEENYLEKFREDLVREDMSFEDYLEEQYEGKADKFYAELKENSQEKIKRDLVLEQLMTDRKTKLSNKEFESQLARTAARYRQKVNAFKKEMGKDWLHNYRFMLERDKAVNEAVMEILEKQTAEEPKAKKASKAKTTKASKPKASKTKEAKAKTTKPKASKKTSSKKTTSKKTSKKES